MAAAQDPGRRTLWRLILAGELLDRRDETAARDLIRSLDATYRVPSDADDDVATMLPPLFALEPDLAVRFTRWGVHFIDALEILAAREPEPRVVEVARRLEGLARKISLAEAGVTDIFCGATEIDERAKTSLPERTSGWSTATP